MWEKWVGLIVECFRKKKSTLVLGLKSRWVTQDRNGRGGMKRCMKKQNFRIEKVHYFFLHVYFIDLKLIYYIDVSVKDCYYYFQK